MIAQSVDETIKTELQTPSFLKVTQDLSVRFGIANLENRSHLLYVSNCLASQTGESLRVYANVSLISSQFI
jgi:hypothetical protein